MAQKTVLICYDAATFINSTSCTSGVYFIPEGLKGIDYCLQVTHVCSRWNCAACAVRFILGAYIQVAGPADSAGEE